MSLSKSQKKIIDMSLARPNRYKNVVVSNGLGLEVLAMQQFTSVGGAAEEDFVIDGILTSDLVFASLVNKGSNAVTLIDASIVSEGEVKVEFSADPGSDAIINLLVIRNSQSEDIY